MGGQSTSSVPGDERFLRSISGAAKITMPCFCMSDVARSITALVFGSILGVSWVDSPLQARVAWSCSQRETPAGEIRNPKRTASLALILNLIQRPE